LQALNLLQDMVSRINANRLVVTCYSAGATGMVLGHGASTPPACAQGSAEQRETADEDLSQWNAALIGSAQQNKSDESIGAMIGARGCIQQLDAATRQYRVSVAWQGLNETSAPSDNLTCGKNQYGDEKQRRIVTAIVRIGDLT
jgi:type IV pilus assembly protein PilV